MGYSVQTDLSEQISEDKLIQLTDDADAGSIDTDVITRAISDADAEIDGYCGTRYDIPFSPVPVMIRKLSVDIAIYNLYARRKGVPEDRQKRYDNALRFLRDVSRGLISLGSDAPVTDTDSGPETTTKKSDRIFSLGKDSDGSAGSLDNY
jgi:phage gp36-like protein